MSKKLIIIIPVLIIILAAIAGYYFFIAGGKSNSSNPVTNTFRNFFPFGGNGNGSTNNNSTTTNNQQNQNTLPTSNQSFTLKLRELSTEPVSGAGTFDITAGTVVHYIEKATGHIFEIELFSPKINRISITTLPTVADAIWGNKGISAIARYLKDDNQTVDTYSLSLKANATSTDNVVTAIAFPKNISDVSVLGSSVFFLVQNSDSSEGIISNFDGSKKKEIWNSPIKELNSQYVNSGTVALNTKPAQNVPGYLYFVDTGTGGVKKILGDISGLTSISDPQALQTIYLEQNDSLQMYLYSLKSKVSTNITPTTFPEKCVWSKKDTSVVYCAVPNAVLDASSLTSWYKGQISFSDDIWKYNLKNNSSTIVSHLSTDADQTLDVYKPILSDNENYLVFMNKIDNSLWSLDLTK